MGYIQLLLGGDFGKFKLLLGAPKITEIQRCQRKTSGISGICLAPPTNLYNILNNFKIGENSHLKTTLGTSTSMITVGRSGLHRG